MRKKYVISIGSNSNDAFANVGKAIYYLCKILEDSRSSSVYTTPSIKKDGSIYTNAVVEGFSELDYGAVNSLLKKYESDNGRVHDPFSKVEIDLDIVIVGNEVVREKDYSRNYFTIGFKELL